MKLVHDHTEQEVKIGDQVRLNGGEELLTVAQVVKPHKPSSTGRVILETKDGKEWGSYFPSAIGAHWIEREDQSK